MESVTPWHEKLRYAPHVMLTLLAAAWGLAFFVPIYNDELSVAYIMARGPWDGWTLLSMRPVCVSTFGEPVPLLLLPGRAVAWFFHLVLDTPAALRLKGMLTFALWLAVAVYGLHHATGRVMRPSRWCLWLLMLTSVGLLPFMLILTRPEVPVSVVLAVFFFAPFFFRDMPKDNRLCWAAALGWLLLASWFFSAHPKDILFAPLLVPGVWHLFRRHRAAGMVCALGTLAILWQAYAMWSVQLYCPEYPGNQERMSYRALIPAVAENSPYWAVISFLNSIGGLYVYLEHLGYYEYYWSDWLPGGKPLTGIQLFSNWLVSWAALMVFLLPPLGALYRVRRYGLTGGLGTLEGGMPMLLWGTFIFLSGFQVFKNFYDGTPVALACFLASGVYFAPQLVKLLPLLRVLCVLCAASLVLLISTFKDLPRLSLNASPHGHIEGLWKSVAVPHYAYHEANVLKLAAKCGLEPGMPRVIVDRFSYLAFREGKQPIWEIRNGLETVQKMGASGMIASCLRVPEALRKAGHYYRGLCCLSKEELMSLPPEVMPKE